MAWQPQPGPLTQLAQCLRDSLSGHDPTAQKNAEQMLRQAKQSPDVNNYLTYLCVTTTNHTGLNQEPWQAARSAAAIVLKNNIKSSYSAINEQSKAFIKSTIMQGLQDPSTQIRNYVGSVITEIVRQGKIVGWPEAIPDLVATVETGQLPEAQDGAMGAIFKICEDNRKALDSDSQSQRPLTFLLPKLLNFTASNNHKVRSKALASINVFLADPIALTVQENIADILPRIVQLTTDQNEEVRRFVCRTFALLADVLPNVLLPHVEGIVTYTLSQQRQIESPELALDAAEFFFEASNTAALRDSLGPQLPNIVPVLLECMIYSEDDQLRLESDDNDDADIDDEDKDIKPQFATSKTSRSGGAPGAPTTQAPNGNETSQSKPSLNGYAYEDDELSDGEIEEDDLEFDPEDEWNLRKCSAAALDSLASHFGGPVFELSLPWMQDNLQNNKTWPNQEAAVLALGAIAPGCEKDIEPHLPKLVPYMLSILNDNKQQPIVRQITCWTLSRFAGWAANLDSDGGKQQFFEPILDGVLQRMLDNNKKTQESAASAFVSIEEAANAQLVPYCGVIVQQFVKCFERYKDRNIYVLYDCVQTLAEYAGPTLAQPELVDLLMPALIARWNKVQDQSREMFPLLECLAFVATALGNHFAPFALPLFQRCIRLLHQNLEEGLTSSQFDQPDKDFLVTSLDLLSSIIQALDEPQTRELATSAQPNMFELLAYCMKDPNNDVQQSAYALLGDCAIYIFPQLQPHLPVLMEILIAQLDLTQAQSDPETAFRVINNACWSCGEIAMRQGPGMAPYIDRLLSKLAFIMFNGSVPESLNENAAIALGRLGIGCHQQLAPHLSNFAIPFLKSMQKVSWTDEKGHAYKGFSQVVLDNPQALENGLLDFFTEMANAPGLFLTGMQDDGPLQSFERVLAEYKRLIGNNWDNFLHNLPPPQEQALRQLYAF